MPPSTQIWRDVHMAYLQICVEGGIAVLILYLMFFWRAFKNLKILRKTKNLDPDIVLFVGALQSSLVGFVVGALFAPVAYQFFPYFAVAFTATLLQTIKEQEQVPGTAPPPPKKPRHFLEVYADHGRTGAVSPCPLTCRQFCVGSVAAALLAQSEVSRVLWEHWTEGSLVGKGYGCDGALASR